MQNHFDGLVLSEKLYFYFFCWDQTWWGEPLFEPGKRDGCWDDAQLQRLAPAATSKMR